MSLTVRTHPLPEYFGVVNGRIISNDQQSGEELVKKFLDFYKENLMGPDWGEQVGFYPQGNGIRMELSMVAANFTQEEIVKTWSPLAEWVQQRPEDFTTTDWSSLSIPGKYKEY